MKYIHVSVDHVDIIQNFIFCDPNILYYLFYLAMNNLKFLYKNLNVSIAIKNELESNTFDACFATIIIARFYSIR